jgi:hypothetical protein
MLAGPTTPIGTMCRAVARTINMLTTAALVDIDRTDDDRNFLKDRAAVLTPLLASLLANKRAQEDFDLGPGDGNQAAVEIGDEVLDRGVRAGNTRAKLGLANKGGLGAAHVFGDRVNSLTEAPLKLQPGLVREAVERLDDLPEFDDKAKIKNDLMARVELQEMQLKKRDDGYAARAKLESEGVRLVVEAADKLVQTKAALDGRFPRQRSYVARFFLDVSRKRKRGEDGGEGTDAGGAAEG